MGALLAGGVLLWLAWEPLVAALDDWGQLRQWVAALGPAGPVAIILLGVLQVIVAPLPGYPVVFVSGALYGGWWGAIYANIGILLAGMLAAMLARAFGRPVVERFVEVRHLQRLEGLLESRSPWLWFFVLLLPTGDLPYFLAGLSRVPLSHYFVSLFAARIPFTFVLTHAAAHAVTLTRETLLLLALPVASLGLLLYWQQERIRRGMDNLLDFLAKLPTSQKGI